MNTTVRVRFAPSPTGPLHIGGVRTALYNYLFAKKNGGTFILRIEDTDQTRYVAGAENYIIETLKWLNLLPQEGQSFGGDFGPYKQSERKALYLKHAQNLIDTERAYYAFDTPDELNTVREAHKAAGNHSFQYNAAVRESMINSISLSQEEVQKRLDAGDPYVIRLKVIPGETITFNDLVRGKVQVSSDEVDDKILIKSDGMPTYHLANIVDDHLMKISHVIRGEEWLPSTPLHILLYRAFGWEDTMPNFVHLPLILKPTGKGKLSKRDGDKHGFPVFPLDWHNEQNGDTAIGFREMGFTPEAVVNFLAFLGWNPGTEQEIFSLTELVEAFDLERISKSGARFNFEKATWFNQQYIIGMPNDTLLNLVRPIIAAHGHQPTDEDLAIFCELFKERVDNLQDFWTQGYYVFDNIKEYQTKMIRKKWKPERRSLFENLNESFANLDDFSAVNIEATVKAFMAENGLGFGNVLPILRIGLSGTMKGPGVFEVASLLGKNTVTQRMQSAFDAFDAIKKG